MSKNDFCECSLKHKWPGTKFDINAIIQPNIQMPEVKMLSSWTTLDPRIPDYEITIKIVAQRTEGKEYTERYGRHSLKLPETNSRNDPGV